MNDEELAKIVWQYLDLCMSPEKADAMIVLSSLDPRVAEYAAELWHKGFAPEILFSGTGEGHANDLLASNFGKAESEYFADVALAQGVPQSAVHIETASRNTGENATFSYQKLRELGIAGKKILILTKPYMTRRAYAVFKKQWGDPDAELTVTSPPIPFENYFNDEQPFKKIVTIMLGDVQRIEEYPKYGWQIPQDIPQPVLDAAKELAARGYTGHEIKN